MDELVLIGWAAAVALGYMTLVWLFSLPLRNASIVDSFWGPGFVLLAAIAPSLAGATTWRSLLVLSLTAVWAGRLATHVTVRNWGRGEDWRYRAWRERAGTSFWWTSYFRVFVVQGLLLVVVAAPILAIAVSPGPARWTALDVVGCALWAVGLAFEAIGDFQLARFKRDPANRGLVMDRGLWRLSRHPNYFGESAVWWGVFLVAASVPGGFWAAIGPATITFLLVRISGVRMLEKGMRERKPGYADYVRRTSAFIPWPPRRSG